MWAAVKIPLILGNDATVTSAETLEIVTNKAVIVESQDVRGSPANRIWKKAVTDGDIQLWVSGLVNSSSNSTLKTILARSTNWGKEIGVYQGSVKGVNVPAHGVKLWRAELATPAATSSASASSTTTTTNATVTSRASSTTRVTTTSAATTP
ncbi:hypothetical protein FRC07_004463 [Ceratobasidium sp. 392]|nr:hypothetical protein FRC07_004463 [Ceratobasidium sp. 392]